MKSPVSRSPAALSRTTSAAPVMRSGTKAETPEEGNKKNSVQQWVLRYHDVFLSSPQSRIDRIRQGVPAEDFKVFVVQLGITQEKVCRMLDIAPATVNRKAALHQPLSREESEKVIGMAKLIGQVEAMLADSGDPEAMKDFDARKWVARWMDEPIPALGGHTPAEYMDTFEGQELISSLLKTMQTGAYA